MIRAVWNGVVIAVATQTRRIEGNHYFPPASLRRQYLADSPTRTFCPWKGVARHHNLVVNGQVNPDAAWYYPHPFPLARLFRLTDQVAFWNGARIDENAEENAEEDS